MGKYIKEFNNHAEYEEFVDQADFDLQTPNISLCNKQNEVHYSPYEKHDYSQDYLTFEIIRGGTVIWTQNGAASSGKNIQYSIDFGKTWTTISSYSGMTLNVVSGQIIKFKSDQKSYSIPYIYNAGGVVKTIYANAHFEGTAVFNVYGNMKSMLNDNSVLQPGNPQTLAWFFDRCNIIDAKNLILPSSMMTKCFQYMFYYCTLLRTVPKLPETTLAEGCYYSMFVGCKSLTTAPSLPATTLAENCYYNMFGGCTSLKKITCLATDISARNCTSNWVSNVPSTGTFVKAASMNNWTTGTSGIPENWTVVDAS